MADKKINKNTAIGMSALTADTTGTSSGPIGKAAEAPKEEMVEVSKSLLEQMQEDIARLKKGDVVDEFDPDAPKEIFVDVRLYKGKPIIDVGSVYLVKDKWGDKIEWISFNVLDLKEPVEMIYADFRLALEKVNVKVIKIEKAEQKEWKNKEYVYKKKVEGYKTTAEDEKVRVIIRSQTVTYDVELDDVGVVQLTQEAVN